MAVISSDRIAKVRTASRDLVREFGFLDKHVAGTRFSGSAVHAILEIGMNDNLTSKDLTAKLRLEKSTISRLLRKLVDQGEIQEQKSTEDGRLRFLSLTSRGKKSFAEITRYAENQVERALKILNEAEQETVVAGLTHYAQSLSKTRDTSGSDTAIPRQTYSICTGYRPGLLARIAKMMVCHCHESLGFGAEFEARLLRDLEEISTRLHHQHNQIWYVMSGRQICGSITIDGQDLENDIAHLRWFVVDPRLRGQGVGRALLEQACTFCEQQEFRAIHLWTVEGLSIAKSMYEQIGFNLAEQYEGDQWGSTIQELKFVKELRSTAQ
ncbi:MAG: bifunctional helix-turn-helix transcriptional regulator/GNAT family N-acetyltransferase [Methyloligellaceae bacterium]